MAGVKLKGLWVGIALVVLTGVFVVASIGKSSKKTGQIEVRMEPIRRARIESWVRAPGQVKPERLVQISSNVQGRVEGLAVIEGARVARGDLLLRLDDERYRSMLTGMQAQVDASRADLALADAQRERSRSTLRRQEQLFADSLSSPEAVEQARTTARVDEARYAAAREALRQRQASLAEVQKDLKETVFYAPMSGIVTALNVEEGENVVTGTMNNPGTVILTLADLDTMEVEADVDESDVVRVGPGQKARIKVDAWEDSVLAGTVTTVGMSGRRGTATAQQQATNFQVKVRITDPPPGLRPGMSADVELLAGEKDSALCVPIQALTANPERVVKRWAERVADDGRGGKKRGLAKAAGTGADTDTAGVSRDKMIEGIFVQRDGKARFVPVRLGLRGDTQIEIEGDVRDGEKVVSGPYRVLRKLKDGDRVKQEKAKKPGKDKTGAEVS